MKMNQWTVICRVADIPVLGSRRVARPRGMDVALFRNDRDQVFALLDRCPHKGGPLSQGIVHNKRVTCPLHNFVIELRSGTAVAPDEGCTRAHPIKVENDIVWLCVQTASAVPAE
jgi:nitrite reductase (NADH) small subunit